ncbi:MAG: sodium:solute symporter [Bacteroidales bacterium]|nr:sodium:solute symporter [Bacteroidales bacterium]
MTILLCFVAYTALLFAVMWLSGRRGAKGNEAFFRAGRRSPWPVVAYGMIGASLSGVTFMSVPGDVLANKWFYMPMVLGYVLGYATIALVLLPLYYRLNLTSIYSYLEQRFGLHSEKTGALFFILSRLLGSALRMYLVVYVLYEFVFSSWGIPFWVPAVVFIAIILLYTFSSGIKTVVWTDMLQTTFLILAAVATVVAILNRLDMSVPELLAVSSDQGYTRMFNTDPMAPKFWLKQVLAGMFITITMTGLDQDMMQKNLTCKSLRDAQKNVMTSSLLFIVVNIVFLCLGAALIVYAQSTGFVLPDQADKIFPSVAFSLSGFTGVVFVLGMVAAGYSSADGTLTALTTTFCYDFLGFAKKGTDGAGEKVSFWGRTMTLLSVRRLVHVAFALLYLLVIIAFRPFHDDSLISIIFDVAGFTYGPLLGLYAFGLFTKRRVDDRWVPYIAILSPLVCYVMKLGAPTWFGYTFGFEILLLNGLITFLLLLAARPRKAK